MRPYRPSPVAGKRWRDLPIEQRFKASFTKNKETKCWEWNKPQPVSGYGGITFEGKQVAAHIASWRLHKGDTNGLCVLHKCDNRRCVNPAHLYLGDKKQNRADFMARHPGANAAVTQLAKDGKNAVIAFWAGMSPEQKKAFCEKRTATQRQKNGNTHPCWGTPFRSNK